MVFPPLAGKNVEESLGARAGGMISGVYLECFRQEKAAPQEFEFGVRAVNLLARSWTRFQP
jgi:hypothetical protein